MIKMNCRLINALMFAAGAAIGSAVTYKIVKDRYEQIVQEEIASIRNTFGNAQSEEKNCDDTEAIEEDEDPDEFEDGDFVEYADLANNYKSEKGGAEDVGTKPYVISPYEFGELDDYSQFELTYYADGILEDEDYEIVTDIDDLIGEESLQTFGEYEDDSVFVRNDRLRADFQILKDYRTYDEARTIGPDRVGDE